MINKSIIKKQDTLVSSKKNPLDNIDLSSETVNTLLAETVGETIVDSLSSFLPVFSGILNFANSFKEKLDDARLVILLQEFEKQHQDAQEFQEAIKNLLTNPAGIMLFQKIIRIINADTVENKYTEKLAIVLKNISGSDFQKLFEEHNYVLSQIEKLSPQALLVLSDFVQWPDISYSSTTTSGVTSGEGWDTSFATKYANSRGISDDRIQARFSHIINELKNNNLVMLERTKLPLTEIGKEVYRYLK